jgi:hypothetical protein
MNKQFLFNPQIRSENHKSSKQSTRGKHLTKEVLKKLKKKIKLRITTFEHPHRIRFFYHDRNRKNPYLYTFSGKTARYWKNSRVNYCKGDLEISWLFGRFCVGYSSLLYSISAFSFNPASKGYSPDDYYKDTSYKPMRFNHSGDRRRDDKILYEKVSKITTTPDGIVSEILFHDLLI